MAKKTLKARIKELHAHNPEVSVDYMAKVLGTSRSYVWTVINGNDEYVRKTIEVDQFGLRKGTKVAQAAALFADGATMDECRGIVGDSYYTLLKKLERKGHQVIKRPSPVGVMYTLIPKPRLEVVK